MASPNSIIVRRWLITQRTALAQRLDLLDGLLAELDASPPDSLQSPATSQQPETVSTQRKPTVPRTSRVAENALLALEAASPGGLTAREVATVTHMPIGSASSKLSTMAAEGKVTYQSPKYFIIHSESQDNHHNSQPV